MNLKLRLQNRVTLVAIITLIVTVIFHILGKLGIATTITGNDVLEVISYLLDILVLLGVVVDPTTQGIADSDRAMQYAMPNKPELPDDYWEDEGGEEDG